MKSIKRKRGRPSNAERAARLAHEAESMQSEIHVKPLSNTELLADIQYRFQLMTDMVTAIINKDVRSLIVSGAAGMSKTYTVESVLNKAVEEQGKTVQIVKGRLTPVEFYMLLYRNKEPDNIVVLDDVDFFKDEGSLAIAKAAFDTMPIRRISWMSQTNALKDEGIPSTFIFNGQMIFITNTDMQAVADSGVGRAPHMAALISRSFYLDLNLHEPRPKMVWVRHIATTSKMLEQSPWDLSEKDAKMILDFMDENKERFRDLSLRTAQQLAQYYKLSDLNWKRTAEMMMMRKG